MKQKKWNEDYEDMRSRFSITNIYHKILTKHLPNLTNRYKPQQFSRTNENEINYDLKLFACVTSVKAFALWVNLSSVYS